VVRFMCYLAWENDVCSVSVKTVSLEGVPSLELIELEENQKPSDNTTLTDIINPVP